MNKFAEQFQNDVLACYQQKMAALIKRAEDEQIPDLIPQTPEEQNSKQFPNNIRAMNLEEAANAIDFERNVVSPLLRTDWAEGFADRSPLTQQYRGIPQRYAETALESGAGIKLPIVRDNEYANYYGPIVHQYHNLEGQPYSKGFSEDIRKELSHSYERGKSFPPAWKELVNPYNTKKRLADGIDDPERNINDIIRKLHNFY